MPDPETLGRIIDRAVEIALANPSAVLHRSDELTRRRMVAEAVFEAVALQGEPAGLIPDD